MNLRLKAADGAVRTIEHPAQVPLPSHIDLPLVFASARAAAPDEITAPIPMRRYARAGRNCGIQEYIEVEVK